MDKKLRDAFRLFETSPTQETAMQLLQAHLRASQPLEISLLFQVRPRDFTNRLNLTQYKLENFSYQGLPLSKIFQKVRLATYNCLRIDAPHVVDWQQIPMSVIEGAINSAANRFDPNPETGLKLLPNTVRWFLVAPINQLIKPQDRFTVYLTTALRPLTVDLSADQLNLALEKCPICNRQTYFVEQDETGIHLDCFDENYIIEEEHTVQEWDEGKYNLESWSRREPTAILPSDARERFGNQNIMTGIAPEWSIEFPIK